MKSTEIKNSFIFAGEGLYGTKFTDYSEPI